MSIVRAGYRQVLKHCAALCRIYPDPHEAVAAVFGVLVTRQDFIAGGYGDTPAKIARTFFERPSVEQDPGDSPARRVAVCLSMIRVLHEVQALGRCHARPPGGRGRVHLSIDAGDISRRVEPMPIPVPAAPPAASSSNAAAAAPLKVALHDGTFLIQRAEALRSQRFYRHTIVLQDSSTFPPYPYLLPPEPVYAQNIRTEVGLPVLHDVLHCIALFSRQVERSFAASARIHGVTVLSAAEAPTTTPDAKRKKKKSQPSKDLLHCEAFLPATSSILLIPPVTISITDFMEVELLTRFVCAAQDNDRSTINATSEQHNVFLYYMIIRNGSCDAAPEHGWHVQILSHHLVVLSGTASPGCLVEMARPGVGGNFPALRPGESHAFEGGTTVCGAEGVLRGTLQVNAFRDDGCTRSFDVHVAPTRLSVTHSSAVWAPIDPSAATGPSTRKPPLFTNHPQQDLLATNTQNTTTTTTTGYYGYSTGFLNDTPDHHDRSYYYCVSSQPAPSPSRLFDPYFSSRAPPGALLLFFFSILLFSLLLLAAVLHISPSRISGPVTASCDMLCAEPLHVQHSASALLSADPSGVVEGRNGSPVAEEQRVWQHCTVSRDLRVRLYRFGAASTFFTLPCVNASDVVRKDGEKAGVLSVLTRSAVLDSCVSWRTAVPHVAGSQSAHAADLLEAYNSNPLSAPDADAAELGGGKLAAERLTDGFARRSGKWLELLSLSLGLPTVAALVRCSAVSRTLLLLLRPHVHAGKSACLAYRAALVPMSDLTRRVCVSPCGTWTAALPERFAVEADPLRCGEPAAPLLTGELVRVTGNECQRATPVHFLAGAAAASPRRVERMAGTALAWAQCRLSAAPCGGLEVVLVSHRGTALVCAEGGAADSALCGVCYRCVRCFVCATRAASPSGRASVSSGEAGPTVRRHVPRQRVLGCSSDGVVLLCAPERTPREVTAVMAAAAPDNRRASVAPPAALLPEAFELHDTHVLTHPRFSGRSCALHLLPFGGGEALPVSMSSFRSWRSLPAAFFQPGCALRFLGVEVVADPCGCDALLVVLGSTGAAKAAATALVTLPSAVAWLREFVLGAGACGAAPRVSGLAAAVELHVARGAAALRHRDEWAARHRRAGLEACDTTRCLVPAGLPSAGPLEMAELVPAPWLAAAAGRRGVAAAEDGLCAMVEECVDALRVELLDTQRAGGDVGLCVSCVGAIFCGVQRGLDAVGLGNGGAAADAAIRRHRAFYGALARALLGALDVLECAGAASAIAAAAASVDPRPPAWGELLRPLFDAAFTATCGAPVLTGGLVPQCSPAVRARRWGLAVRGCQGSRSAGAWRSAMRAARCGRCRRRPGGTRSLADVASCVAAGPEALASLTVLDIYWAARRLFLASGPAAALELLSSICGAASCAANVQQLRDMYAALDAKQRPIAERLGRSRPPRRRLSIDLKRNIFDDELKCVGDTWAEDIEGDARRQALRASAWYGGHRLVPSLSRFHYGPSGRRCGCGPVDGWTPVHFLCNCEKDAELVGEMMEVIGGPREREGSRGGRRKGANPAGPLMFRTDGKQLGEVNLQSQQQPLTDHNLLLLPGSGYAEYFKPK
eukprot:gene9185-6462_t